MPTFFLFHVLIYTNHMATKHWVIRLFPEDEMQAVFSDEPSIVQRLLWRQDIRTREAADIFLSPDYALHTHDPFLLKDMERAVSRIGHAIRSNEKIIIFGDYDADGICGSVVFHDFFRAVDFSNFQNYIPHRYEEGYGLKMRHIEEFASGGAKLLITIDCGVTNYKEIERAGELGVDVIVIDHHIVPPQWPPAYAIIDYKHPDDAYPSKYLSGAGLAFKVVQGILVRGTWPVTLEWSKWLLDVVAIAGVADMVPILGENRVLVHYGLKVLSRARRAGLKELYRTQRMGVNPTITSDTIGFTIAPRINAASRMGHATTGFEFLTTESSEEARWLVTRLEGENEDRKKLVEEICIELKKEIAKLPELPSVFYFGKKEWLPGVLGIAATRLVEEYGRSAFLYGGAPDHMKGSCRTASGINAVEVMRACADTLLEFGGHQAAGGFSLEEKNVGVFGHKLREVVARELDNPQPVEIVLEAELHAGDVTWEAFNTVERFQPFGQENKKPLFLLRDAEVVSAQVFGSGGKHLRLGLADSARTVSALKFNAPREWMDVVAVGAHVDAVVSFDLNEWNGNRELRLRLEDIRLS